MINNCFILKSQGDSDSYSNANLDVDQTFPIKKEKESSEDGIKSFELCANSHHFPGNYLTCDNLCFKESNKNRPKTATASK